MKHTNHPASMPAFIQPLALAAIAVLANVQATIIEVGDGPNIIGTTTLAASAGVAKLPCYGAYWAAAGCNSDVPYGTARYSSLTSPTLTVVNSGVVTLKFKHRYDFADTTFDGGAIFVSVDGGAPTYLDGSAIPTNGYTGDTSSSVVFGGNKACFSGGDGTTEIESIATLGPFNAGQTVAVTFRGGWDWSWTQAPPPDWEIRTVEMTNETSTLLNVDFLNGPSGFSVTNDPTTNPLTSIDGPWLYDTPIINQFEINATTQAADKYVSDTPASVIDLNGAKLKVVLLEGTLAAGQTFTLFDLSDGSTLAGSYSSIDLPQVAWDLSGLQPGGNGKIVALSGQIYTYTWNNTTPAAYDWESTNWTYSPTSPAPSSVWPDGASVVVNLNCASGTNTWNLNSTNTTVGELHFGAVSGATQNISGAGKTLTFDNGPLNAELTRGEVSTQVNATIAADAITLNSDLDVNITSHITSYLTINSSINGPGGLNIYNAIGDEGWPGLVLNGTHTYAGDTTINSATVTLPAGSSISGNVVFNTGTLRLAYPSSPATLAQYVGGTISGTGNIYTEGNLTFDTANAWQGYLRAIGNFPGPIRFTSIKNVGAGPSALGNPQTEAQGRIYLQGGGSSLEYIGSGDTTDRVIEMNCFGDFWTTSIKASGTTTVASPFKITSTLAGGGTGWLVLGGTGAGEWAGNLGTNASRIQKNDSGTWTLSGTNSYTGVTNVNAGTLILNGTSSDGDAVTVASDARLGGNGETSSAVTINSGAKMVFDVADWTGVAGTGFSDLEVGSLNLAGTWTLDISSATGFANFSETGKTFAFVTAPGGITGFNPANVTIVPSGFAGSGDWSIQQTGNTLELVYTVTANYPSWANSFVPALTDKAADADPDGDGLPNSIEYVLGTDPRYSNPGGPEADAAGDNMVVTFTRTDDSETADISLVVEVSTDLVDWTTHPSYAIGAVSSPGVDVAENDADPDTITVTIPKDGAVKMFARLRAIVAP